MKRVNLSRKKRHHLENIEEKSLCGRVFTAREGGRRVQKSPAWPGVEVKMFNPYLGWMDAEAQNRERKFLRRMAFIFVLGTFVLPVFGGMMFLAAAVCRFMP